MSEGTPAITIAENGIHALIAVAPDGDVRFLHLSALPCPPGTFGSAESPDESTHAYRLVELQITGENRADHHGLKHTGTMPGTRLQYRSHCDARNAQGRLLEIDQGDEATGLLVTSHLQLFDALPVVRSWTTVANRGQAPVGLEYVSSFALTGLAKEGLAPWDEAVQLYLPHNTWMGEGQWRRYRLPELGLARVYAFSIKRLCVSSTGTWSSAEYLPMGYLEHCESGAGLAWQIEHDGSWQWELSDRDEQLYLQLSGPTDQEHQWWKLLQPGETFTSVPVAVAAVSGGPAAAFGALTQYRRRIRRPNADDERLPVIFNDYMNCLNGDPTTEKLLPLIDAAADAGCEYFVIDAGWYGDGSWWSSTGDWRPSGRRFPGGLRQVLDRIRGKGMVPGLWLELELMGEHCPIAAEVDDAWFFSRHGRRVRDNGRFGLDYRHPAVIAYADEVVDRLVKEYGVGYIKMDYNNNLGVGTDYGADSPGDGLLQHNRAYLAWLDRVFARYPDLVIENCGSGAMRMDYALLSRHSIQSTSDQQDYRRYAAIAAAAPAGVTPEQAGHWAYPLRECDEEAVIFNMVNALLGRILLSGETAQLDDARRALVREAVDTYKSIRADVARGLPIWPLGLPGHDDQWLSMGLVRGDTTYLAVWRLQSASDTCLLPLQHIDPVAAAGAQATCLYPVEANCRWAWRAEPRSLSVSLPQCFSARLFRVSVA
jgi:alpha-galactosidase